MRSLASDPTFIIPNRLLRRLRRDLGAEDLSENGAFEPAGFICNQLLKCRKRVSVPIGKHLHDG